jgi:hypothetical protein
VVVVGANGSVGQMEAGSTEQKREQDLNETSASPLNNGPGKKARAAKKRERTARRQRKLEETRARTSSTCVFDMCEQMQPLMWLQAARGMRLPSSL